MKNLLSKKMISLVLAAALTFMFCSAGAMASEVYSDETVTQEAAVSIAGDSANLLAAPTLSTTTASLRYTGATTGTAPAFSLYVQGGSSSWAENVTSVTIIDLRDNSEQVLTSDQYEVSAYRISLYRTDEDPIMSVTTKERTADFEIIVSSTGYEDLDGTYTVNMYGAQTLQLRYLDGDGNVIKSRTFSKSEIIAMSESEELYYNTICAMTGLRSFRAKGTYLTDLLNAAGIRFSDGMTMVLRTNDMADGENDSTTQNAYYSTYGSFTYEEMMGTDRYAFTDIYSDDELKASILSASKFATDVRTILGSSAEKTEVYPMIAYNYVELQYPQTDGESIYNYDYSELTGYENCFRFLFGIAMDEDDSSMISGTTTTWSASYAVFGIDIIDENYDADAETETDTLVIRRGNHYYFQNALDSDEVYAEVTFGKSTDEYLVGDWDGDGVDTICVRRGNVYYFQKTPASDEIYAKVTFGSSTDEVVAGDWDGDGADELCVRSGRTCSFQSEAASVEIQATVQFGKSTDEVLAGDWDGDGADELCVKRGNVYYFQVDSDSSTLRTQVQFGKSTDTAIAGDWDGDGVDTLGLQRGKTYYFQETLTSTNILADVSFGKSTDVGAAGSWK